MIEFLTNINILNFAREAGSSSVLILVIFTLIYMLNRWQKKYIESMEKYGVLLEKQVATNIELIEVVKKQRELFLLELKYLLTEKK